MPQVIFLFLLHEPVGLIGRSPVLVRTAGVQSQTCSESIPAESTVEDVVNMISM